ncbi:PH domain-containing protein [Fulvimarina sp. 2208YS6-2-32]|uniref:PH domain-containing protein n=1 Tax=Fulvimarina uroteuthidis TaxID=3098149 RepID=A0ABU5HX77_9HYPH|nr:PH domain-containing protein [Fulvimarina sp. 2208YS6-2-32]MDY8107692.1 PH domain-containing protein [Fulvimarina sp. 2208YS6-2-32]
MGLLSGLLGLTSDVDIAEVRDDLAPVLIEGETVTLAFKVVRDLMVFTERRLILVDKQGLTGSKRRILSIPYRAITSFAIETAGRFDADSEMTVHVSGQAPIKRELSRSANISGIQKALATGVLGS